MLAPKMQAEDGSSKNQEPDHGVLKRSRQDETRNECINLAGRETLSEFTTVHGRSRSHARSSPASYGLFRQLGPTLYGMCARCRAGRANCEGRLVSTAPMNVLGTVYAVARVLVVRRFRCTSSSDTAAGVTPGTRAACPIVAGRTSFSRCLTSLDNPRTSA